MSRVSFTAIHGMKTLYISVTGERNFALRLGIVRQNLEQYENVHKKLRNIIPHGNRAQNYAQVSIFHFSN